MPTVHRGITRTVVLTRRYAVKVPSLRGHAEGGLRGRLAGLAHGLLANQSERQWSGYEPWVGLVAPVLWSWLGGVVQVYPRCEPLPVTCRHEYVGDESLPVLDPDPGDHKADNYGLLDGRIVRIDYDLR
ncbi:hypothetical protein [Verrucosispora sp. NA02020]|uniref:hypothetical protein n=1 Tax=Verrucosispora sp. NA02020 TaxID=2742132 RepID=UPI001591B5E5|nr:hypothetical protein [Verrucosispora sp. NA02020]QKW15395.1 hypothetical protein HUT12_23260 [Verrucosispora sp. NA02020]